MLLLKTAIEAIILKYYNETNNIDNACKLAENELKGIKLINNNYKVSVYSIINNTCIGIIDIKNK